MKIANNTVNQTEPSYKLDKNEKIRLLRKCAEVTDHRVPNSLLYTVKTLGKFLCQTKTIFHLTHEHFFLSFKVMFLNFMKHL